MLASVWFEDKYLKEKQAEIRKGTMKNIPLYRQTFGSSFIHVIFRDCYLPTAIYWTFEVII